MTLGHDHYMFVNFPSVGDEVGEKCQIKCSKVCNWSTKSCMLFK